MFSFSNPFDADIEKATNEKNTTEDWGVILDICDKVGQTPANAKYCLKSIIKRLNNADPHVVLKAVTLLDACVNNCGKTFHLEIASRDFEGEYRKLITKSHPTVQQKLKELLKTWAEGEFKSDPQLNLIPSLYSKLKQEGIDFTLPPDMVAKKSPQLSKDPNVASNQQEVDDIAKAIELSLKEKSGSPRSTGGSSSTGSSLYPSANLGAASHSSGVPSDARKVRALYDFEAAEDNELTFLAGEIIHVVDDSDQNWWKGYNQRGEGLFPANFVTADLSVEPESLKHEQNKKTVQFQEKVNVKAEKTEPEEIEINEEKIDRLLHLLHEADPCDAQQDTQEMLNLEEQVNNMGPLIDTELERVDRKHAQLTQLSSDLVEALNLYHTLMREPQYSTLPKSLPYAFPQSSHGPVPPHIFNGNMAPHGPGLPSHFPSNPYGTIMSGSAPTGPPPPGSENRPSFISMPPTVPPGHPGPAHSGLPNHPGAPPAMTLPPHFQMPPQVVMPPPQHMQPSVPDDRSHTTLPPQFAPGIPNYVPQGGPPFSAPQMVSSTQPGGPPPQNFAQTPSSQHLM